MIRVFPSDILTIEDVIRAFPTLRQSVLAKHDDCPLSAYMEMRWANGWSTHPQARGTIFHRTAAEILREMHRNGTSRIPREVAWAILIDVSRQRDVPPEDIVRVPLREMRDLRMAVEKFAKDNEFSTANLVSVEERYSAEITYPARDGGLVTRTLTGQPDAVLWGGDGEVVVLDWKDTWALPPEPKERKPDAYVGPDDAMRGISYHGFFQQRFYGWLLLRAFPSIQRVTLREFYARRTQSREATLTRDRLYEVEHELSVLVQAFDDAILQGEPAFPFGWFPEVDRETGELLDRHTLDIERMGRWKPQPGKHCGFCPRSRHCPIDEDTRIEVGAPPATEERARALAAELQAIDAIRDKIIPSLKAWVELAGRPVPVKWAKGRRVLGWYMTRGGRRFGFYTPDTSDRGGHPELDRQLEDAMREATARAKAER